jgi:hypothetical protein
MSFIQTTPLRLALLLAATLGQAACGGGGSASSDNGPALGTLSLAITDAPVHDVAEVWVQFSGISVKPKAGSPIDYVFDEPRTINLLALSDAKTASLLSDQPLAAGAYNWVRLNVNADADGTFDSYVLTDIGAMVELEVPSQQGLQLSSGFTVTQNQATAFVIDWDLNKGLVAPAGANSWKLRPSLRITDQNTFGTISGSVAESLMMADTCSNDLAEDIGNNVYVYAGSDIVPSDISGADTDPLVTAEVKQDINGLYGYIMTFLSPGDYTVAFTCQAIDDSPDTVDNLIFTGTVNATVVDRGEAVVNFD